MRLTFLLIGVLANLAIIPAGAICGEWIFEKTNNRASENALSEATSVEAVMRTLGSQGKWERGRAITGNIVSGMGFIVFSITYWIWWSRTFSRKVAAVKSSKEKRSVAPPQAKSSGKRPHGT